MEQAGSSSVSQQPGVPSPCILPPSQARRPGLGRSGRPVELLCNYFCVDLKQFEDVFQYDVCIWDPSTSASSSPSRVHEGFANKNLTRLIMEKLSQVYGATELGAKRFAYDGEKSLFVPSQLPFQTQEFSVMLDDRTVLKVDSSAEDDDANKKRKVGRGRARQFKVKITYAAKVKMAAIMALLKDPGVDSKTKAQDGLRALDIVLRQHAVAKGYLLIKDNFFSPTFGVKDIGEGVQTCKGFHLSFRPTLDGLCLNLDVATTTLIRPGPVLDFIKERFNPPHPHSIDWDKVKRVLKGVKVITPHTQIIHRIIGISAKSCSDESFVKKIATQSGDISEAEVTILAYYEMQYKINIRFPDLPCIVAGRAKRPILIPVELCHIVEGQRYTKSLSSGQRQKMIDQARQNPDERKRVVQKAIETSEYNVDPLVSSFHIKIDCRMKKIGARLLDAPSLKFGNVEEVPRGGRWNFTQKKMASGAEVRSWVMLVFDGRVQYSNAESLANDIARACNTKGMQLPPNDGIFAVSRNAQHLSAVDKIKDVMQQVKQSIKAPPTFMLCVLPPPKPSDIYAPLKKMMQTDTKFPITTQCMLSPKQFPLRDQNLSNIALKLNAKIGGYNSWLSLENQMKLPKVSFVPTIIFGLDVSHGPPGYSDSPSIAAVVGSREWPYLSKYGVRLRGQSRKVEMIAGLYEETNSGGMVAELLLDFYSSCKLVPGVTDRRPKQIIIFRDGVSESQFHQVLREEYVAFKKVGLLDS